MITHVKFVRIPTGDQDRALEFWTEQIGFTLVADQPFSDSRRSIELRVGTSDTHFVLFTPDGQEDEQVAMSPGHGCERPGDVRTCS